MSLTASQKDELLKLIRAGQKIVAIKRYRELTGLGLQEALEAVNRLADGGPDAGPGASSRSLPSLDQRLKEAEAAVMQALGRNNEIEAIRRYREITSLGLRESKDAVDAFKLARNTSGRISAKVAASIIAKVAEGRKEEALTLAMSSAGLDDTEARALIKQISRNRITLASCVGGCLLRILVVAALLALAWYGAREQGLL
jgi:ribosomal protein L7/L12